MLKFQINYFLLAVLLFITELLIGFYLHDDFIRPYGGDVLVVILIYCSIKAIAPVPALKTAIGVLLFAFTVELLQYFNLIGILGLQQNKAARVIIGTSFSFADLACYTVGIIIVLLIENFLNNVYSTKK